MSLYSGSHSPPADQCLSQTWRQLSGQARTFVPVEGRDLAAASRCVLLPATVNGNPPGGAVLLSISEEDARAVAAAMFGLHDSALSSEDVDDACREVCNQFSHCVTRPYSSRQVVRLGLPATVPADLWSTVVEPDTVLDIFESSLEGHRMQVAVLSRLHPAVPELCS